MEWWCTVRGTNAGCLTQTAEAAEIISLRFQVIFGHIGIQPMLFTVCGGEPEVTHRTSRPKSTGECIGQQMTFGLHCAPNRGECYHGPDRKGNHAVP